MCAGERRPEERESIPEREPRAAPFTVNAALLIALLSALMYAAGNAYLTAFFSRFQVALVVLDLPTQYAITAGSWVFASRWWALLSVALGGAACVRALCIATERLVPVSGRAAAKALRSGSAMVVAGLFAAFLAAPWLAARLAASDLAEYASSGFTFHPRVRVHGLGSSEQETASLQSGCYRLLVQTGGILLVFLAPTDSTPARYKTRLYPFGGSASLETLPPNYVPETCVRL